MPDLYGRDAVESPGQLLSEMILAEARLRNAPGPPDRAPRRGARSIVVVSAGLIALAIVAAYVVVRLFTAS